MKTFFIPLAIFSSLLLFACEKDDDPGTSSPGPVPSANKYTIMATNGMFEPGSVLAHVGDTIVFHVPQGYSVRQVSDITWRDNGQISNGGFDFGEGTFEYILTPDDFGVIYYVAPEHVLQMNMKGMIAVSSHYSEPYYPNEPNMGEQPLPNAQYPPGLQ